MRATLLHQACDVRVENVDDPKIQRPTDAVVRIVLASIPDDSVHLIEQAASAMT
jgi:threonine dehydrogenase-like Zn-dependent dehydrogenase